MCVCVYVVLLRWSERRTYSVRAVGIDDEGAEAGPLVYQDAATHVLRKLIGVDRLRRSDGVVGTRAYRGASEAALST